MARRIKSLRFNLGFGISVPFHREHRSKKGRTGHRPSSLKYRKYKLKKKYGEDAELFTL